MTCSVESDVKPQINKLMTLTTPVHSECPSYIGLSGIVAQSDDSLLTEVKRQWAMLVLGWVTVSVWNQLWDVSKLEFLSVMRLS